MDNLVIIKPTVPTTPLRCKRTEVGHFFIKSKCQHVMSFELHSLTCDQVVSVKYKGEQNSHNLKDKRMSTC